MGLLNAAGSVPALLFALIAGVWVDRLRRRPVPMMADLGRFLLLGLVSLTFVLAILRIEFLYLLMADESQPDGWRGQRLSDDAAALATEDYIQLPWPRGEQAETVYVHVVSTRVRKRSCCRVIIVRRSLQEPLSQARYWASRDLEASAERLWNTSVRDGRSKSSSPMARRNWAWISTN